MTAEIFTRDLVQAWFSIWPPSMPARRFRPQSKPTKLASMAITTVRQSRPSERPFVWRIFD
jgi:hypothetical protein